MPGFFSRRIRGGLYDGVQKTAWAILLWLIAGLSQMSAQVTTATILGTVTDSTGAIVPGVSITIRNVETGITRAITTDEQGRYRAAQLAVGHYEVAAEAAGFQTLVRSGIELTVEREATVDLTLQVGAVSESVTQMGISGISQAGR